MQLIMKSFFFFLIALNLDARVITLNQAIEIGLKNNQEQKISQVALQIANVQYKQAQSILYPSFEMNININRRDEGINYRLKGSLPALGTVIPIDLQTTSLGRDTIFSSLDVNYALYTGGKISSIINQAHLNKLIKQNTIIRKNHEVIFKIKKYFYGYILANELYKNAKNSFARMQVIERLTKNLYESDSLRVKKTDYLRIQVITSLIESTMQKFATSKVLALSALKNSMGFYQHETIKIKYDNSYIIKKNIILENLIKKANEFNPEIQQIKLFLKINEEQIKEAKSEYYPKVGVYGSFQNMYNSYEYGLNNDTNKNSWSIGLGINIPLFSGFKSNYKVLEKKLEKHKTKELEILIEEAISMQIKHALTQSVNSYKQVKILEKTKQLASDNTELNIEGYQIDLIETADLIQAQLTESYTNADYSKSVYDYQLSLANLNMLIGKEHEKISDEIFK